MKILHGAAFGTGGGCIAVIGEMDNGLWFIADNLGWSATDYDTRNTCKEMGITDGEDDDLAVFWIDRYVEVDQRELDNAFHDFCIRYDMREPGITNGYEHYNGGVWGYLYDHIDWSHTKIDEYSKPIHFKDIINNKLDNTIERIIMDIQNRLDIEECTDTSAEIEKAKEKLVEEIINLLDSEV